VTRHRVWGVQQSPDTSFRSVMGNCATAVLGMDGYSALFGASGRGTTMKSNERSCSACSSISKRKYRC